MELAPVTFQVVHAHVAPGDCGSREHPNPYVSMDNPDSDLEGMLDKDAIVIPKDTIRVLCDYPLEREVIFELKSDAPEGFKRAELAQKICQLYHSIYQEESETASDPGRAGPNSMNRGKSFGKYGIWGHDLCDLALHSIEYNADDDVWDLGIDS